MDPSPQIAQRRSSEGEIRGGDNNNHINLEEGKEHERGDLEENAAHFPGDREHRTEGQIGEDLLSALFDYFSHLNLSLKLRYHFNEYNLCY